MQCPLESNRDIIQAEQEVASWAKICFKDFKFYTGLSEAIEKLDKIILRTILEVRYGNANQAKDIQSQV